MRVLIVEDDIDRAQLVTKRLAQSGFDSDAAETVEQAEHAIGTVEFAAIILDLGLSGQDGLVLLREMRERGDATPVLIASARSGLDDRVEGLRAGADDYLAKPFSLDELIARLHALLRRPTDLVGDVLTVGNVRLHSQQHQVKIDGRVIPMRLREVMVLAILMRHKNSVVPHRCFEDQLFGQESNAIEVYVHRLRKQLIEANATVTIHNVRGVGCPLLLEKVRLDCARQ